MPYDPKKVIAIAKAEIGYLEKETNSNLDDKTANAGDENYNKYARDLDKLDFYNGRKNGYAWCDVFVDWCFVMAYGMETALAITFQPTNSDNNCGAGCQYSRGYYEKNGRLFDVPEPGDQAFFWNSGKTRVSHTGLVVAVDSKYVYTVEGNTSSASGVVANGGAVRDKKYKLNYARLAGFGRPGYGNAIETDFVYKLGERLPLKKGDEGDDVKELQGMLVNLGYDLGTYGPQKNGADGDFGAKTEEAVKAHQLVSGLPVNGVVDQVTLDAIRNEKDRTEPHPDPVQPPQQPVPAVTHRLIITGTEAALTAIQAVYGGVLECLDEEQPAPAEPELGQQPEVPAPDDSANEPQKGKQWFVTVTAAKSANVRSKPGTKDGAIRGTLKNGTVVPATGASVTVDDTPWYAILVNGSTYWISSKMARLECKEVDIAQIQYVPKGKIPDISKYQGNVDWGELSKEADFCILRASCGTSDDVKFDSYVEGCRANNLPFGVYHYLKATTTYTANQEAETFAKQAMAYDPVFWVVDCEHDAITTAEKKSCGVAQEIVNAFCERLKELAGKDIKLGVYIGHHLYKKWALNYSAFDFVWIPRYGSNSGNPETAPSYACDLWQFTSKGRISGVKGDVDLNIITGTGKDMAYFRGEVQGE